MREDGITVNEFLAFGLIFELMLLVGKSKVPVRFNTGGNLKNPQFWRDKISLFRQNGIKRRCFGGICHIA